MTVLSICCISGPCKLGLRDALACTICGVSCRVHIAEGVGHEARGLEQSLECVREVGTVAELLGEDGVPLLLDVHVGEEVGARNLLQVGGKPGARQLATGGERLPGRRSNHLTG